MKMYTITGYDALWNNYLVRRVVASSQEEAEARAKELGLANPCRFEVEETGRRY